MADKKIFVRQVRSTTRTKSSQEKTLVALGLGKVGSVNVLVDNKAVRGMIRTVLQWLEVKHV
jgi:large subunit ribosomal protein L30